MSDQWTSASPGRADDHLTTAILDAVVAIVAREGFEGATIRRVATLAGCSAGAVQKRFPSRADLLRSAFELVAMTALARIADTEPDHDEAPLVRRHYLGALETLPLDARRRDESLVWTSFLLRAAIEERLTDLPRRLDRAVHEELALELAQAQEAGDLARDIDPDTISDALLALVDGIALRMLYTAPAEHPALLTALDAGLHALLPQRSTTGTRAQPPTGGVSRTAGRS